MRRAWAAAALALAATGCVGIPGDPDPRPIAGVTLPPPGEDDPAVDRPAAAVVYLVRERLLVGVHRIVPAPATPAARLAALRGGPTDRERRAGIRTALVGALADVRVTIRGGFAVVDLPRATVETGTEEQILALAQIVFTLTADTGIAGVSFTAAGRPLSVPRADGSLARGPVSRTDYRELTRRSA